MNTRLALLAPILLASSLAHARAHVDLDEDDDLPKETTTSEEDVKEEVKPEKLAGDEALPTPRAAVPWLRRIEGGIGFRWGSVLINNIEAEGKVKQLHLDGGLRFIDHRLFLYGQYALQMMTIPLDEFIARGDTPTVLGNGKGLQHRFGAHGRYSFARAGEKDGGMDIYADVGVGVEHIRWDAGGAWTRPDIQLALGLTAFGIGDTQHGGLSAAIVLTLAPRNDVEGAPAVCGGPCDYATPPTGTDRSIMFDVTMNFGK